MMGGVHAFVIQRIYQGLHNEVTANAVTRVSSPAAFGAGDSTVTASDVTIFCNCQ
jgi:hypothetical protein